MRVRVDVAEPLLSHEVETERRLDGRIETAQRGIESMLQRGYRRWYLMYSGGKDSTAALVWTCSVVSQDRTMQKIVAVDPQWRPLLELRNWLVAFTRNPENRVRRPNGMPGRLTMAARQRILQRVQATEHATGMCIIRETELAHIRAHWASGEYGDEY